MIVKNMVFGRQMFVKRTHFFFCKTIFTDEDNFHDFWRIHAVTINTELKLGYKTHYMAVTTLYRTHLITN